METTDLLQRLCEKRGDLGALDLRQLYKNTADSIGGWGTFLGNLLEFESFPRRTLMHWLQYVSSSTFVSGRGIGEESIFTPAMKSNRDAFREFMGGHILRPGVGATCIYVLPLYEAIVRAIAETRSIRPDSTSRSAIVGLTRIAGEALDGVIRQSGALKAEAELCGCNMQEIQKQQMSNFHIGLREATRGCAELESGDILSDKYWTTLAAAL